MEFVEPRVSGTGTAIDLVREVLQNHAVTVTEDLMAELMSLVAELMKNFLVGLANGELDDILEPYATRTYVKPSKPN